MPYFKNEIDKHKYNQSKAARKGSVVRMWGGRVYGNYAILRTIKGLEVWSKCEDMIVTLQKAH